MGLATETGRFLSKLAHSCVWPDDRCLGTSSPLHVGASTSCLGFLLAWWLGSRTSLPKELGASCDAAMTPPWKYQQNFRPTLWVRPSWRPAQFQGERRQEEIVWPSLENIIHSIYAFVSSFTACLRTTGTWSYSLHSLSFLKVKVAQSCLTLCDPIDYTVHGILQARILEWVAVPFSKGSSQPRDRTQVSHIAGRFFTSWATREAPEYWNG